MGLDKACAVLVHELGDAQLVLAVDEGLTLNEHGQQRGHLGGVVGVRGQGQGQD